LADADVGMSKDAAAITHSGSTSLTVASTNGPVLVESVTFTGDAITGAGALTMSGDLALATDKFTVASSSGNTACAGTFEVGGNKFTVDAAGAGVFASTVTASGSQLTSDARWKTNVANLTRDEGLDAVLALRPVRYDWGADSPAVLARGPGAAPLPKQLGFLAQEVREALPRGGEGVVVEVDGEGHLGLAYDKLTAVLVRALQEEHAGRRAADEDATAAAQSQWQMIERQSVMIEQQTAVVEQQQRQIEAATAVAEQQAAVAEAQSVQNEEQQRQIEAAMAVAEQQAAVAEAQSVQNEEQQRQIGELQTENDVMQGRVKRLRRRLEAVEAVAGTFNEQAILNEKAFIEQDMRYYLARRQQETLLADVEELRLLVRSLTGGQKQSDAYMY
jgi:hypothetical protein